MFAMDCAAITMTEVGIPTEKWIKKQTILIPDVLSRHSVTTQESPCSWITLEEARHFFEAQEVGGVREAAVSVISFDHDLEDGALDYSYDYNKRVST